MKTERPNLVPYGIQLSLMNLDDLERQKWAVRAAIGRTRLLGHTLLAIACLEFLILINTGRVFW